MGKRLMSWFVGLLIGYLVLLGLMFVLQRSLLYPASKERPDLVRDGATGYREVVTRTDDGLSLTHWYREATTAEGLVVVAFHGNAGHIGHRVDKLGALVEAGHGLILVGYRGYSANPGSPSEEGLTADGRSVLAWLAGEGIAPERIVLYGESLGSAVAVKVASETKVAGLMLEAPPSSIADVAQAHYWYLPARWLLHDKWDSQSRIAAVGAPILIFHGDRDRVVPERFGRKLFAAAPEPKKALWVEEASHNDLWNFPEVEGAILEFLASLGQG